MFVAKSLKKAVVPSSLIEHPSPANLQPTRLAIRVDDDDSSCSVYVASGSRIYRIKISIEASSVIQGKESLLVPQETQFIESAVVDRCPHLSEIQSIVLSESKSNGSFVLGSVDSYGQLIVSKLNTSDVDKLTFSVSPRHFGIGESSWTGLCFSPNRWSMAAVAHSFTKSIDVYDQDIHLRTFHTLWYPSSISFMPTLCGGNGDNVIAVTEGCQLTIWDLRMKENSGCVQRICGSVGDILYALCNSSNGSIATGGADRNVTIFDPRRWSALSRWVHCSKYEITGLAFSLANPDCIFVQGVDYELFCGKWKEHKKIFSFRGDSNWLGFSKCPSKDVLGGWCNSGSIFVVDFDSIPD